jgi:hypothetical protein
MVYVILKHIDWNGEKKTVIVNDSEGESIEFETLEQAEKIRELFQNNTTHSSVYEIREIGHGTSTRAQ